MNRFFPLTQKIGFIPIAVVVILGLVAITSLLLKRDTPDDSLPLTQTFNASPTGFTFRYPDGWVYEIPITGLMVMGKPETIDGNQPGPTFTIQRNNPVSVYASLDEALDQYLRRGPLRSDRQWHKLGDISRSTFLQRDALVVDIEGAENQASPVMRGHIIATTANNTFVYIIIFTAPLETWERDERALRAILGSLQILE
jgi:hypothetical protein